MNIDFEHRGYHFRSEEGEAGMSTITISKGGTVVREFKFPTYKIFNISAHADDVINGLEKDSDAGLLVAGSDGLGGNAYRRKR